jgi:hypothetical protein
VGHAAPYGITAGAQRVTLRRGGLRATDTHSVAAQELVLVWLRIRAFPR